MPHTIDKQKNYEADMALIAAALKRDRNLKTLLGSGLAVIGIVIMTRSIGNLPYRTMLGIAMLSMLFTFSGLYFLLKGLLRYDVQKNYLLNIITQQPEMVVWVYIKQQENMPFGIKVMEINTLYICLVNHEFLTIRMRKKELDVLMPLLKKRLSKTTFGYSKSNEQLYEISPDLLRK